MGRGKGKTNQRDRFWQHARIGDGCWEWTGPMRSEYGAVWDNRCARVVGAHRTAFELSTGAPAKGYVLHRCNNKRCVRPSHLYDGTQLENLRDLALVGGMPGRKLTYADAQWVRANASHLSRAEMARKFGVNDRVIYGILRNETYKYRPESDDATS